MTFKTPENAQTMNYTEDRVKKLVKIAGLTCYGRSPAFSFKRDNGIHMIHTHTLEAAIAFLIGYIRGGKGKVKATDL